MTGPPPAAARPRPPGRRPRGRRLVLAAALALWAAPAPADSLAACGAPSLAVAEAGLRALGFARVRDAARLTPVQADHVAWTLMDAYLDRGDRRADRGGETVAALLDLQRRAVPGLLRRVDGEAARFRLYVRGDDVMTISEAAEGQGGVRRSCRLALGASATEAVGATALDTARHPDAPARGLYSAAMILPEE